MLTQRAQIRLDDGIPSPLAGAHRRRGFVWVWQHARLHGVHDVHDRHVRAYVQRQRDGVQRRAEVCPRWDVPALCGADVSTAGAAVGVYVVGVSERVGSRCAFRAGEVWAGVEE